jgi:outer membrane biosynthesis protein TonB
MSEEQGNFFGQLKNQIIAGVGVAITAAGATFMDAIKVQLGLAEPEPEQTEEVVQQPVVQQPEIIINIPEQKPAETKTIIKEVPVEKKEPPKKTETEKRKEDGWDW